MLNKVTYAQAPDSRSGGTWGWLAVVLLLLSLTGGLGTDLVAQPSPLGLYWIDVEGGGATLVVTPDGESILVDAGENLDRDASRVYHVAARVAGLKQIDYFIATHWHADHYGGAIKLSKLMPIKSYYGSDPLPDSVPEDPQFSTLMPLYKEVTKGRSVSLNPGDTLPIDKAGQGPKLEVKVLAANRKVIDSGAAIPQNSICRQASQNPQDATENSKSLVLLFKYGKFTFLDGGDLTRAMEEKLVCPGNLIGVVDLFQINHHGLDLSNNSLLIQSIQPRVVVVNNGPLKGAEPKTMKTLLGTSSIETVWQIHRNLQAGSQLNVASEFIANQNQGDQDKAEFIQASVSPDGAFSVMIGSNGNSKNYRPR
jgi:beta-lactamase superfamily II metal-dependent hydrolase